MYTLEELQKQFINLRLGCFIHFSSGSVQFNAIPVEDWEFDRENAGKPRLYPFDEKDWNPQKLDCDQWAAVAKSGGMKFATYTSKHHEGFAMWPTAYSEHSVRNGTNKTDAVAEYLRAFRKAGIVAGQEIHSGFEGPGALCQKLTGTWFWRSDDTVKEPASAAWAVGRMNECFASNVNFILNLSPNESGRIDDNLAAEYAKLGKLIELPRPLEELPPGWLKRKHHDS